MAPPDAPLSPAALDQVRAVVREEVLGAPRLVQIGGHELLALIVNLVGGLAERLTGEKVVVMVRDADGDDLHYSPDGSLHFLKPGAGDEVPYVRPEKPHPTRLAPLRSPGGTPSAPGPA